MSVLCGILEKREPHKHQIMQRKCVEVCGTVERNESALTQLAQCRFPGLATSNAKILIYFSNKIYRSNLIKRHLPKCWLQFWSGRVRVAEFRNYRTRPDQRQSGRARLVECGHNMDWQVVESWYECCDGDRLQLVHRVAEKKNHFSSVNKSFNTQCNLTQFSTLTVNEYCLQCHLFNLWN